MVDAIVTPFIMTLAPEVNTAPPWPRYRSEVFRGTLILTFIKLVCISTVAV